MSGRHLEQDDNARFAELRDPPVNELDPHGRLAAADRAFEQDDVAARNSSGQNIVEPNDTHFH
jgi:hypothetical protein